LKCQIYLISSILLTAMDAVVFSFYCASGKHSKMNKYFLARIIFFSVFVIYKLYAFWVVRCLIIGIIRTKRSSHMPTVRKRSSLPRSAARGSNSTQTSTLGRMLTPRGSSGSGFGYGAIHGIDDILKEIEFPEENYVPLHKFQIGNFTS